MLRNDHVIPIQRGLANGQIAVKWQVGRDGSIDGADLGHLHGSWEPCAN
jgi:hypothetical protein